MDCDWFVQKHEDFSFEDDKERYLFSIAQHAWKNLHGDGPVTNLKHIDEHERQYIGKILDAEVNRLYELCLEEPELKYASDMVAPDKVDQKRDELLANGHDEELVDTVFRMDYGNLPFTLNGLQPQVLEHALKEWKKEIDRVEVLDNLDALTRREQGLEPSVDPDSAQLRAYKNLFSHRDKDLNELIPDLRDAELMRWEKEVEKQSPHRNEMKRLLSELGYDQRKADEQNFDEQRIKLERSLDSDEYEEPKWKAFIQQHLEPGGMAYGDHIEFGIAQYAWQNLHGEKPVEDLMRMSFEEREGVLGELTVEINRAEEIFFSDADPQLSRVEGSARQEFRQSLIDQGLQQNVIDDVYAKLFSERDFKLENLNPELLENVRAQLSDEIERQKINDQITANVHKVEDVDLTERIWSGGWRSQTPEKRAFEKLFGERSFDLNDLSEPARTNECAKWREEVVREMVVREFTAPSLYFEPGDSISRLLFGDEHRPGWSGPVKEEVEGLFNASSRNDQVHLRDELKREDEERER